MHILFLSLLVIISLWCIVGSVLKLQIFLGFFFFFLRFCLVVCAGDISFWR